MFAWWRQTPVAFSCEVPSQLLATWLPRQNQIALVELFATVIATTPIPLPPEAPFDRLTLTARALKATREVILVVTGASKKALIEDVLAGNADYPVSDFLRGSDGPPVTIYWSE